MRYSYFPIQISPVLLAPLFIGRIPLYHQVFLQSDCTLHTAATTTSITRLYNCTDFPEHRQPTHTTDCPITRRQEPLPTPPPPTPSAMSYRASPRRRREEKENKKGAQVTVTVAVELDREKTTLLREIKRLRLEVGLMATRYEDARKEIVDMVTRLGAQSPPPVPARTGGEEPIEGLETGGGKPAPGPEPEQLEKAPERWQEVFKPDRDMSRTLSRWRASRIVEEEIRRAAREWEDGFRQYCNHLNDEGEGGKGTKAWNEYVGEDKWDAEMIEWWTRVVRPHRNDNWIMERFDKMCWRASRMTLKCEIVEEGTDLVFRSTV